MKLTPLILIAFAVATISLSARTWTHEETGRTIEAEYQGTTGKGEDLKVNLRMVGRGTIPYLLADLSEADQIWVREQMVKADSMGDEDEKEGSARVLGEWKGFMANSSGEPDSPMDLEITEDRITARRFSGEVMGVGTYRISGSGETMRIDVDGTSGEYEGKDYEGIITVEGNTLKWCSTNDQPSARRPRKFQTDIQQNHFLLVMEKKS